MARPGHIPLVAMFCLLLPAALGTPAEEWSYGSDAGADTPRGKKEDVKRIRPPHECEECSTGLVACRNHEGECQCVVPELQCDGANHCAHGEDEDCDHVCHGYMCEDGECVGVGDDVVCNGATECADGSDELGCEQCDSGMVSCDLGGGQRCIPIFWVCDREMDCPDGSDERNCNTTCGPEHFRCTDGQCIAAIWQCDREDDCHDGSDELNCTSTEVPHESSCAADQILCLADKTCLAGHYRCNGENDCGDWSDEVDCPDDTCPDDQFRCHGGDCILRVQVCDGEEDCPEAEDEARVQCQVDYVAPKGLGPKDCLPGFMRCDNVCLSELSDWVCDGERDCSDGIDEQHCVLPCGEYTCRSTGACLPWSGLCDGHHDCLDGDDESGCEGRECQRLQCSHLCNGTGGEERTCLCPPGYTLDARDNTTCIDVDECEQFSPCSQYCDNTRGSFQCSCARGYYKKPGDQNSCKVHDTRPSLIFANRHSIREISMDGVDYSAVAEGLLHAVSLDFHFHRHLIFWSDVTQDVIMRAFLNGTGHAVVIRWGLRQPMGVCVDWYNDHLYWLDTGRIEVAQLDGTNRRTLLKKNVRKPRALALHPHQDLMIWTDWGGNATIESAYLDGRGRRVLVSQDVHWPNGITIDYPTQLVYWVDAKIDTVNSIHLDGSHRKLVFETPKYHPFAITVFEDDLYWTDWETHAVHSASKKTGKNKKTIVTSVTKPMDIRSVHAQRQQVPQDDDKSPCAVRNGGCSHLCLPGRHHSASCLCPHGLALLHDRRTCASRPDNFIMFAQRNNLRLLVLNDTLGMGAEAADVVVPVDGVVQPVTLDFFPQQDLMFWSDLGTKTISRAHINGSRQELVVQNQLDLPAGLAVDWVTEKLYWTDQGTNRIEVAHLNGSSRSLLVWQGLDKPRDIVVDPQDGYMFWSDWGEYAKIERAGMDGKDRKVFVSDRLKWPNGLAIDHSRRVLYWLEAARNCIEKADLDGTHRETLIGNLPHPFGLTLWEDKVIWSDWKTLSVHIANVRGDKNQRVLVEGEKGLMDVRAFQHRHSSLRTPCHSHNGGCSHLCLLRNQGYSCACPTGVLLKSDNHTCEDGPLQSLVFSVQYHVRQLSLDTPYSADTTLPLLHQVVDTLDVDPVTGDIFLADKTAKVILRTSKDGRRVMPLVTAAIRDVEGLALDTTGRKMYWTDFRRRSLEVCELDGTNRRVLFTNLDKPRAIVTYHPGGKLFWTDWHDTRPRIEVADMDGNERRILVRDNIQWPNGLTIDWTTEKLYWTDAKTNTIQVIRLNGFGRHTLVADVPHPYGITILGDHVYWSDWQTMSVNRTDKTKGHPSTLIMSGLVAVTDIKAIPGPPVRANACGRNNGQCSHLCLRHPSGFSCACPTGLLVKPNNKNQCEDRPRNSLVFASEQMLGRVSLDTEPAWDVPLDVPGSGKAVLIEYHQEKDLLFYIKLDVDAIFAVSMKNLSNPWKILDTGLNTPDGLALDWFADVLYFTDAGRKVVEAVRVDGCCRKVLVKENLSKPRAIVVWPEEGLLFWSDWDESKIEKSNLDGTNRVLVSSDVGWPNGIALDPGTRRLYWNDAQGKVIKSSDLDGANQVVLVYNVPHPFGLTLLGNHIYWTDWANLTIERADKTTGYNREVIIIDVTDVMAIKGVSQEGMLRWTPCADRNGGCTHLCFSHPDGVRCGCPDVPDHRTCYLEPQFEAARTRDSLRGPHSNPSTTKPDPPGLIPLVAVLVVVAAMAVAAAVTGTVWWRHKRKGKMEEGVQGAAALTYTNPTYSASNSDVNTSKPFTWRRLHQEAAGHQVTARGRMFEEKGEVAALISEGSSVEHESPPPTPPTRPDPAP